MRAWWCLEAASHQLCSRMQSRLRKPLSRSTRRSQTCNAAKTLCPFIWSLTHELPPPPTHPPGSASLFLNVLGRARILTSDVAGGLTSLLESLRLNPTRTSSWLSLASVYLSLDAAPAAEFALRQALISCAPDSPLRASVLLRLSSLAHLVSNAPLRAEVRAHTNSFIYLCVCVLAHTSTRVSQAVVEALKLSPTNLQVRFMLGVDKLSS